MEIDLLYKKDNMLGEGTKILPIKQFSFFLLSPPFLTATAEFHFLSPPRISLDQTQPTIPNFQFLPLQSSSSFLIVINTYNRSSNMYEDCAVKVKIGK